MMMIIDMVTGEVIEESRDVPEAKSEAKGLPEMRYSDLPAPELDLGLEIVTTPETTPANARNTPPESVLRQDIESFIQNMEK